MQLLIGDLNKHYRHQPALHRLDCEAQGFEWITSHDAENSVFAWVRRDGKGQAVIVVSNFTPVPREGFRLGVPEGPQAWCELLNTDSAHYGGSNLGNGAVALPTQEQGAHGRRLSISLTLPPLATLFLVPHATA
jgi:1,4-alpha-glucan branching enzyme